MNQTVQEAKMTELQPLSQCQETDELSVQEMQFWLDKAVAWGQADSSDSQKDTCRHLSRLKDFLQQLLAQINSMVSGLAAVCFLITKLTEFVINLKFLHNGSIEISTCRDVYRFNTS